jgi:hypothetical protein
VSVENDPRETAKAEDGDGALSDLREENPVEATDSAHEDDRWLALARDAWRTSGTWFDSSQRVIYERALANFRGVHPPGSKYHTDAYSKKSRIFRPKTRSAIRRGEAGHAIAFFSTSDIVHCSALNESDPDQVLAANVHNDLLNMRLQNPQMHWFQTIVGGSQDAMSIGVVISKQYWRYETADITVEETYNVTTPAEDGGIPTQREEKQTNTYKRVTRDHPDTYLIPVENFRVDPACDWRDPVNTSPYVIELQPTYVWEIKQRIAKGLYKDVPADRLGAAIKQDWDSIRRFREGPRADRYDTGPYHSDFQIVWVHHVIVNVEGQDYVYDTLGQEYVLSKEVLPIQELYRHCESRDRPYAMGAAIIEAHKPYPSGIPLLIEDLQEEANDIANLRIDNVKQAINKRWFVKRGRMVDVRALIRNVPGAAVMMTNTDDVREIETRDVTASSFQEQDRLNLDIDDVIGNFSGSSVSGNRKLNETVGGMNLLSQDASQLQEFMIRTVAETWVQPVLRQLVKMEAIYETDIDVLRVVSQKNRSDIRHVLQVLKMHVPNVNVNVGFQSTSPQKRIEKLSLGLATIANFAPDMIQGMDRAEFIKEVMGALGYKDGSRFFPAMAGNEDPQVTALKQQVQNLTSQLQGRMVEKQVDRQSRLEVAQIAADKTVAVARINQETQVMLAESQGNMELFMAKMQDRLDVLDRQIASAETDIKRRQLFLQREALSHEILQADREFMLQLEDKRGEQRKASADAAKLTQKEQANQPVQEQGNEPQPIGSSANDQAGVVARGNYGLIPGVADGEAPP